MKPTVSCDPIAEVVITEQNLTLVQENQLKTNYEVILWKAWQQALSTINTQRNEMNQLILRVQCLENTVTSSKENQAIVEKVKYSTDEEQLKRETAWIVQKTKKKKKKAKSK